MRLLAYAFWRLMLDLSQVSAPRVDAGVPARIVPYKRQVIRYIAVVGGLAAVLSMAYAAFASPDPW